MRIALLILVLAATLSLYGCARGPAKLAAVAFSSITKPELKSTGPSASPKVDFQTQIKPILQQRCQPCHFSGGVMYQRLPFDRPETIKTLGSKLFTRLKDEKERQLIRQFLAQ